MRARLVSVGALALVLLIEGCASSRAEAPPTPVPPPSTTEAPVLEQQIEHLRALRAHGSPADRARASFELAELYVDQDSDIEAARYALADSYELPPYGELDDEQRSLLGEADRLYREVIDSTEPAAQQLDPEALYGLAYVQERLGDRDSQRTILRTLVADHPEHPLAGGARLVLADAAFHAQSLDEALRLYEEVLQRDGPNRERLYARYMIGWLAFNGDAPQLALEHWAVVVRIAGPDPSQRALASSAMKDCVLAYARVGRPEAAKAFFLQVAPAHASELLVALAQRYLDEGRADDAARVGSGLGMMPSR